MAFLEKIGLDHGIGVIGGGRVLLWICAVNVCTGR